MRGRRLKPLVRAANGLVLRRRTAFFISRSLEEELFRAADVLSEGSCRTATNGASSYFGSTMITFDLSRLSRPNLDGGGGQTYQHFANAVEGSVRFRLRAQRIAYREVMQRVSKHPSGPALVETTVRLNGDHLHLDVDLEVPLEVISLLNSR
jgi:hypothetical protein